MKAVFVTGGKQYYVAEGETIYVEKLDVEEGSTVDFDEVLQVGDKIGTPTVKGAKVTCEVEKHGKALSNAFERQFTRFANSKGIIAEMDFSIKD